ncbi:MAG: hypothetical protein IPG04_32755 [Polyangiaceae bacterium]|nr:hypothetical protein [Polyangiaceae bacterium]
MREQAARSEGVEKAEENREIGTPGEQPEDQRPARAKDLRGHEDQAVDEGPELHAQHAFAFGLVLSARQRGLMGSMRANHAFRDHAIDAITM